MAELTAPGYVSAFGTIIQMMGQLGQGRAARAQGDRARAAAEFAAWQAEQQAGLAVAYSQRQALEVQRQGRLEESQILAVAAASGGGASDPTITRLIANNAGFTAYKSAVAIYEGEAKARELKMEAITGRIGGAQAQAVGAERQTGYALSAAGTGIKGAASLYEKYGRGGPGKGDQALIGQSDAGITDLYTTS